MLHCYLKTAVTKMAEIYGGNKLKQQQCFMFRGTCITLIFVRLHGRRVFHINSNIFASTCTHCGRDDNSFQHAVALC